MISTLAAADSIDYSATDTCGRVLTVPLEATRDLTRAVLDA